MGSFRAKILFPQGWAQKNIKKYSEIFYEMSLRFLTW
jgi:hypothetical protein